MLSIICSVCLIWRYCFLVWRGWRLRQGFWRSSGILRGRGAAADLRFVWGRRNFVKFDIMFVSDAWTRWSVRKMTLVGVCTVFTACWRLSARIIGSVGTISHQFSVRWREAGKIRWRSDRVGITTVVQTVNYVTRTACSPRWWFACIFHIGPRRSCVSGRYRTCSRWRRGLLFRCFAKIAKSVAQIVQTSRQLSKPLGTTLYGKLSSKEVNWNLNNVCIRWPSVGDRVV